MATDAEALEILNRLAIGWGGQLKKIPKQNFKKLQESGDFSDAPFANYLGVDYKRRVVFYLEDSQVGGIIHEMGHVFACHENPNDSDEWTFFGWEYLTAVYAGCLDAWFKNTADYTVDIDTYAEFSELSEAARHKLLKERVQVAKTKGLVSESGEPLCVRSK